MKKILLGFACLAAVAIGVRYGQLHSPVVQENDVAVTAVSPSQTSRPQEYSEPRKAPPPEPPLKGVKVEAQVVAQFDTGK